ncbi:MAG: hypothetical protein R8M45_05515, partial [Ghiorsea sp.]
GRTFTWSVKVKGVGVSVGKTARMFHYAGSTPVSTTFIVPAEWTRFSFTQTIPVGETGTTLVHRVDFVDVGIDPITGNDLVYLDEGTIEEQLFATSYIPTTTQPVARLADNLSIPAQGIAALSSATLVFDADLLGNTNGWVVETEVVNIYNNNWAYGIYATGGTLFPSNFVPIGNTSRMVVRVDSASLSIWRDGAMLQTTAATGAHPFNVTAVTLFSGLYGHLRNFRIYDQALTDQEIGAL